MRGSLKILGLAAVCGAAGGCGPQRERERLNSFNARDRAQAAIRLAEAGDGESVHRLVPLLQDADSAVRMYAILSLERLTGQTYGYRYYDSEAQRGAAVERWQAALRDGRVSLRPDSTPSSVPQPAAAGS